MDDIHPPPCLSNALRNLFTHLLFSCFVCCCVVVVVLLLLCCCCCCCCCVVVVVLLIQRDNSIILLENECSELKKKVGHYESQLEAYVSSSESAVVSRLHSEVSDVEHRVQSRNLEIQILERHVCGYICVQCNMK